jgi:hypothetical protein
MISLERLLHLFNSLSQKADRMLEVRRQEPLSLFVKAWAERRLTPEFIMFRCTWM